MVTEFDSDEEKQFYQMLLFCEEQKWITNIERGQTYKLFPNLKAGGVKEFTVLKPLEYTPDFEFDIIALNPFTVEMCELTLSPLSAKHNKVITHGNKAVVEIKPAFDRHGKTSKANVLRKILWFTQGTYVDLIKMPNFMAKTFNPNKTKSNKYINFESYVEKNNCILVR